MIDANDESKITAVNDDSGVVRREIPKYDGVYLEGKINNFDVVFTIDTGASSTVISKTVYDKISPENRPELCKNKVTSLENAGGKSLQYFGRAKFEFCLGSLKLEKLVIVADISDEALLGADILQQGSEGPADILLSRNCIVLNGQMIPLTQIGVPKKIRKIYAADDYSVEGLTEQTIDCFPDRDEGNDNENDLLIEGMPAFSEKYSLEVAPTLVNISKNCTVKIRILNPFPENVSIKQDTVIGVMNDLDSSFKTQIVLQEENADDRNNFNAVRRVVLDSKCTVDQEITQLTTTDVPQHLHKMYDESIKKLNTDEQDKLKKLLINKQNAFSSHEDDLGLTNLGEHEINTGDTPPIRLPPRRTPHAFAGEDAKAINQLMTRGIIRPSTSPWASPVVLVRKKNGEVRHCIDYRRVNSVTKRDAFPLPRTEDCLDAVAGAKLFTTLDITSAYNQIPVKAEDIPKTAFVTRNGLFEYVRMPFGLCNAPATFQRIIELALRWLQWTSCLIYLDDIIIFGKDFDEHISRLKSVLERITLSGLKLRPDKCHLFKEEVTFLGHVVSKNGILPNPDNVTKLVNWGTPQNVTEVRAFLGLANYYRRFIRSHSEVARPLTQLTKKDHLFVWTSECEKSFPKVKQILISPDIMAYPLQDGQFVLNTDACDFSIGTVLSQVQNGKERVIAYGSKTLLKSERNYCVTDKELLAMKVFIEYYKHYLLGRRFLVRTDYQALKWLFSLKDPKQRIARWIEFCQPTILK